MRSRNLKGAQRAWTTPRSGGAAAGPSSEKTNPDYNRDKLRQIRKDYLALDPQWRPTFLEGLGRFERKVATGRIKI